MYRYRIVKQWIDSSKYPSLVKVPWIVEWRPRFWPLWPLWSRCEFNDIPGMEFDTRFVSPENAIRELQRYTRNYNEYHNPPTVAIDPDTLEAKS